MRTPNAEERKAMQDLIDAQKMFCEHDGWSPCVATHIGLDGRPYCDIPGHDPDRPSR